jgi:hypothetical protein
VFPDARLVIIERDLQESIESTKKVFPKVEGLENVLKKTAGKIEEIKGKYNPLVVPYYEINDNLKKIWEYCLPDIRWDNNRFELLKDFNITIQCVESYYNCLTKDNPVLKEVGQWL